LFPISSSVVQESDEGCIFLHTNGCLSIQLRHRENGGAVESRDDAQNQCPTKDKAHRPPHAGKICWRGSVGKHVPHRRHQRADRGVRAYTFKPCGKSGNIVFHQCFFLLVALVRWQQIQRGALGARRWQYGHCDLLKLHGALV